ncbi:MAG: hypothetical protein NVSMB29_06220 [Candidatus Dormibacteria bacterium]
MSAFRRVRMAQVVRRLNWRRRLRDRLLAGMLVVALFPLAAFAALVAVELGAISSSTTDETHRAVVEDAQARQQGQVSDRAKVLDIRLGALAGEVRHLGDQMNAELSKPLAMPLTDPLAAYQGVQYSTAPSGATSLIVGQSSRNPAGPETRAARIGVPSASLLPFMQSMRRSYPEIEAVWVVDKVDSVIRTVPGMDVPQAIIAHRLDPAAPLGPDGETIFSTSQRRFAAAGDDPEVWADPSNPALARSAGPFWTDPYTTRRAGGEGVTVWLPLGDGRTLVGADVTVDRLTQGVLGQPISAAPGAYPLLLSSSNKVLVAAPEVSRDFQMPQAPVGDLLARTGDRQFNDGLASVEKSGRPRLLRATLHGVDRAVFTAPIFTAKWVLATSVPVSDLEPDIGALSRGISSGIHRLLLYGIPVGVLLVALAFSVASVVARRLTGPVDALRLAAEHLALGHTEQPVPPQGEDEVGQLAASLERMRREINASRDAIRAAARELEGRVTERTAELRSRNDELLALNALARSLTRSLEPEVILRGALETMRAVLPVDAGRGFVVEDNGDLRNLAELESQLSPVPDEALLRIARAAIDEGCLVTRSVASGELVGVPLGTSRGPLGALAVLAGSATAVRRRETLLGAVADQAGLALRTARLSAEGRDLAVLEERTRLAREIHDTLAQQLAGVVIQLQAAEGLLPSEPRDDGVRQALTSARDGARAALQEARRSVWDLRPAPLSATGVVAAIQLEVERWSARTGIPTRLRTAALPAQLPLQPQAEVALLRIVQEALYNVGKHSKARRVVVRLRGVGSQLELSVRDDGEGFDPSTQARPGSFGLTGMDERARLAGGTFSLASGPRGTTVVVRLPLGEAARRLVPV